MTGDRAAELRRIGQLRHFELIAELSPHVTDPWHEARFAGMSRDQLISQLLPPLHDLYHPTGSCDACAEPPDFEAVVRP